VFDCYAHNPDHWYIGRVTRVDGLLSHYNASTSYNSGTCADWESTAAQTVPLCGTVTFNMTLSWDGSKCSREAYDVYQYTPTSDPLTGWPLDCLAKEEEARTNCISGELLWYDCELDNWVCVEHDCAYYQAQCDAQYEFPLFNCTEDSNGNGVYTCQNDECLQEAKDWAVANCHDEKYLDTYECATDIGTCFEHDCSDLFADCVEDCGGDVDYFSCLSESGETTVSAPCVCVDDYDISPDEALPDNANNDATPSDLADTEADSLKKITDNTVANNNNLANLAGINRAGFNNLHGDLKENNQLLGSINDTLNDNTDHTGSLPDGNDYSGDIAPEDIPEEEDLEGTLTGWISSTPFLSNLQSSQVLLSNPDACLSGNIAGQDVQFCFSDYESTWDTMGAMLLGLSGFFAFFIVARR